MPHQSLQHIEVKAGSSARSMQDLPLDIFFELFRYLSGKDIAYLLSTCRALHAHLHEPQIWQGLVARYGLRYITHFGGWTFYDVYTQLLYPYGALIGLWASDHPYRGNVIEFHLLAGSVDEQAGIIGEFWRFSDAQFGDRLPRYPEYRPMLKIAFDGTPENTEQSSAVALQAVRIFCSPQFEEARHLDPENALGTRPHFSLIEVLPPTEQGYFFQGYRRTISQPEFPCANAPWYDAARERPSLRPSSPVTVDQRELVRIYPAVRLPIIFTSSTGYMKPAAITFKCGKGACTAQHQPLIPFDDITPKLPRYFPLRRVILPGVDPSSDAWTLRSLEGLWLGMFGQQGTELLFVSWHEGEQELRACKITGDTNVPRGACSWMLHAQGDVAEMRAALLESWTRVHPAVDKVFSGTGTISERGFSNATAVGLIIGITGADELDIWWDKVSDMRSYIRYKGRHL